MQDKQTLTSLWADESVFRGNLDRAPFSLAHSLSDHPLFELPRLVQLAQLVKRNSNNVVYDAGDIRVEDRWNRRPPKQQSLEEVMERVDRAGAWVILKHTEQDPEYKTLMETIMSDIQSLSGRDLGKTTKNLEAQIMLTSPGRVTPYHLDNECNVLLQIKGEKDIFIFDQTDREVLTETELERFWIGDWNAGEYKNRAQDKAHAFRLAPGRAVHIPVNAPHWVKNDANVSISLSINFEWKDESVPNVYRANFFLRKLGIQPRPPGQSGFSDKVKGVAITAGFVPVRAMARGTVRLVRRVRRAGLKKSTSQAATA
ncbi:MAG: cupin-like domain-containing protein [Terriglobales bacterium]